jgi:hypothetical protein
MRHAWAVLVFWLAGPALADEAANPAPPASMPRLSFDLPGQGSRPAADEAVEYHFVAGLDPNGDGFLALRSGYGSGGERLAKMEEGTLLTVIGRADPWLNVRLQDGREGWAHSNWIRCCVTSDKVPAAAPAFTLQAGASCDQLWTARNLIWKRYGYCFTTQRAIRALGNEGCNPNLPREDIRLSTGDAAEVERLLALEKAQGCD